jgi:hypothetical protein
MAFSKAVPWNSGEEFMHQLLRVPPQGNPTSAMLTPQASFMLQHAPLLAFGTLDAQSRPWATLWGGSPGFSEPLGGGLIGTRTPVDGKNDPVVRALMGDAEKGERMYQKDGGKIFAGLAIDLMTRKRVKIAGRVVSWVDIDDEGGEGMKQEQIKLITRVEQSLGNCPKYLNQYEACFAGPLTLSRSPSPYSERRYVLPVYAHKRRHGRQPPRRSSRLCSNHIKLGWLCAHIPRVLR